MEFKKEARIAGVELPIKKSLFIALTYVHGIGRSLSYKICEELNINPDKKVSEVSDEELDKIRKFIMENYKIEGELKAYVVDCIKGLISIGCYRGLRHRKGLPVRGQRTKNNSRTRRKRSK